MESFDTTLNDSGVAIARRGRVFYVGSFSKTLFRHALAICLSRGLLEDVRRAKRYDDLGSGSIEQHALATFMHSVIRTTSARSLDKRSDALR
jgi:DNA-binding transcriptional MocR family regulator